MINDNVYDYFCNSSVLSFVNICVSCTFLETCVPIESTGDSLHKVFWTRKTWLKWCNICWLHVSFKRVNKNVFWRWSYTMSSLCDMSSSSCLLYDVLFMMSSPFTVFCLFFLPVAITCNGHQSFRKWEKEDENIKQRVQQKTKNKDMTWQRSEYFSLSFWCRNKRMKKKPGSLIMSVTLKATLRWLSVETSLTSLSLLDANLSVFLSLSLSFSRGKPFYDKQLNNRRRSGSNQN